MERKEKTQLIRIGLVYNVARRRFDIMYKGMYKGLPNIDIHIASDDDQEDDETPMSMSAA